MIFRKTTERFLSRGSCRHIDTILISHGQRRERHEEQAVVVVPRGNLAVRAQRADGREVEVGEVEVDTAWELSSEVKSVAFDPSGTLLAAADQLGNIFLFDITLNFFRPGRCLLMVPHRAEY